MSTIGVAGQVCSDGFDHRAVALLRGLCRGVKETTGLLPRRPGVARGADDVDDLALAAGASEAWGCRAAR